MSETSNIYDYLDGVRKRSEMYGVHGPDGLRNLGMLIHGYYGALNLQNIVEDVPALNESKFALWLYRKTGIGAALGWAHIINEIHPDPNEAFDKFFEYLKEYRNEERT